MKDHPRLVLDGVGIGFEMLNMLGKPAVLLLEFEDFTLQRTALVPFLLVNGNAIRSEDHVIGEKSRKGNNQDSRHAMAPSISYTRYLGA